MFLLVRIKSFQFLFSSLPTRFKHFIFRVLKLIRLFHFASLIFKHITHRSSDEDSSRRRHENRDKTELKCEHEKQPRSSERAAAAAGECG
jgi:hypothetical protein